MAPSETVELRKCRSPGCGCTTNATDLYCSEHCENRAIMAGQGCECGHPDCRNDKPSLA